MAELIDKGALINQLRNENIPFNADINSIIIMQPTVTEADIRAKAIEDTVRQLYNLCYLQTWVKEKDLEQLAEQLKGE